MGMEAVAHVRVLRQLGESLDTAIEFAPAFNAGRTSILGSTGQRTVIVDMLEAIAGRDPKVASLVGAVRTIDQTAAATGKVSIAGLDEARDSARLLQFANVKLGPSPTGTYPSLAW